ncbi:phage tail protein [Salmonella enterica subsp. enterica]|nr:phage tail protein [Salmonella enterica subsp. enterica serovar Poona]EBW2889675.1 phage tail protein [Salmonella enterica subsp. enterica serovar Poona]ECD3711292.1 phage tail protein [Salmonella enterica subsp. enterica serovar Poona]ECG6029192.1 phage tail protein [Salmonella enterica subsp. enterica serovar Poona]ECH9318919.1 phage tail protein [Salmonella enterica subsp. enterica serovar Poona]
MSGNQYQGTATVRVNGQEYATLAGATFTPSGHERKTITGARVYGFSENPKEATLDCKFPAGGGDSPGTDTINTWKSVTIEFIADTGEVHMMTKAWSADRASLTDAGEISAKFASAKSTRVQ